MKGIEVGSYPVRHVDPRVAKHRCHGRVLDIYGDGTMAVLAWDEIEAVDQLPMRMLEMACLEAAVVMVGARDIMASTVGLALDRARLCPQVLGTTSTNPVHEAITAYAELHRVPMVLAPAVPAGSSANLSAQADPLFSQVSDRIEGQEFPIVLLAIADGECPESRQIAIRAKQLGYPLHIVQPETLLGAITCIGDTLSPQQDDPYPAPLDLFIGTQRSPHSTQSDLANPYGRESDAIALFYQKELQPQLAHKTGRIYRAVSRLAMQLASGHPVILGCDCDRQLATQGVHAPTCHGPLLIETIQAIALQML